MVDTDYRNTQLRLLWCSSPKLKLTPEEMDNNIIHILNTAYANNKNNKITGLLAFTRNYFIEVMEGGIDLVTHTFMRVAKDPRHDRVAILSAERVNERLFANWSMAYAPPDTLDRYSYVRRSIIGDIEPLQMAPREIINLLFEIAGSGRYVLDGPLEPPSEQYFKFARRA